MRKALKAVGGMILTLFFYASLAFFIPLDWVSELVTGMGIYCLVFGHYWTTGDGSFYLCVPCMGLNCVGNSFCSRFQRWKCPSCRGASRHP